MISAILALQKRSKFFPDKFILTCIGFNFPYALAIYGGKELRKKAER